LHEPQLRFSLSAVGTSAPDGELGILWIERQDGLPGFDTIAFLECQGENASAGIRRQPRFGGFNMA